MPDHYERIRIFMDTMKHCDEEHALQRAIRFSKANQKICREEDALVYSHRTDAPEAEVRLTDCSTVVAAGHYPGKKVCALNFASSVTPGGGVLNGAGAQEECICRATTLYPAIADRDTAGAFYRHHHELIDAGRFDRRNNDDCIYTPGVIALKADHGDYDLLPEEARYSFDVLTCAAPDLRHGHGTITNDSAALFSLFEKRIDRIFKVAAVNGAEVLILGAFGCGAFGNDPALVASAFQKVIASWLRDFAVIDFAIPDRPPKHEGRLPNHKTFRSVLGL